MVIGIYLFLNGLKTMQMVTTLPDSQMTGCPAQYIGVVFDSKCKCLTQTRVWDKNNTHLGVICIVIFWPQYSPRCYAPRWILGSKYDNTYPPLGVFCLIISYPVNITCIIAHFEPSEYFYEYSLPLPSIHHPWSEYSLPLASKLGQVAILW